MGLVVIEEKKFENIESERLVILLILDLSWGLEENLSGWPLVREKSGKFDFSSRSGKSQGILQIGQGNFKYQESQGKVREFHKFGPKYVL